MTVTPGGPQNDSSALAFARKVMSEKRAFFGTIALSTVNAVRLGLQLLVLPILGRILGPDAFGLIGLAIPIVLLAGMMCDAGMGNILIRHPNPSAELESTAFWLSLMEAHRVSAAGESSSS